ncbi:hypothetical protein D3C72_1360600 [compost metagenome]
MIVTVVEVECLAQAGHQFSQLLVAQIGRRAAPQVQLRQLAAAIKQRPLQGNFTLEVAQVLGCAMGFAGNDLVAGAVVTQALAERNVDVRRQGLGHLRLITGLHGVQVVIERKGLMKLGRGGIGGVARPRTIVFLDQGAVEFKGWHRDRPTHDWRSNPYRSPAVQTPGRCYPPAHGRRAVC